MSRPVYPYPATAEYTGTREMTEAENWQQGPDAQIVALHDSLPGEDFSQPTSSSTSKPGPGLLDKNKTAARKPGRL